MIKRQWYWNLRETRVFFMNGWKSARLGRLGICCVKKCSLKSTLCCLTPLFICLFVFYFLFFISISSYQVKLGFSFGRLQKILCLVFLFVCCFFSPPLLFLREHLFFSQTSLGFFSKISHFGIYLLGFLKLFSSPFLLLFLLSLVYFWGNCFQFQIEFHKRRTSTV